MTAGTFPDSSKESAILVQYSMIREPVCIFANFLSEYADQIPVVIYVSLTLGVACGN